MPHSSSVDSGWSWVVCIASFLVQFLVLGTQNSFGTFFIEFLQDFKQGESATAWIGSIAFGLTFMNGPLATALCARWNSRIVTCLGGVMSVFGLLMTSYVTRFSWLYVTYGIVWGLGASLAYFGSIAALTLYFKRHLSLAYGICLSGSGVGTPVMILLLEHLNKAFNWRKTFQLSAAICALVFLCGITYLSQEKTEFKMKSEKLRKRRPVGVVECLTSTGHALRQLARLFFDPVFWRDRAFVVWVTALGFVIFGYFIPFVFVIRIAKDIGVPDTQSTLLIAYLAITQTVSKIVFGKIGDVFRRRRIQILQVLLLIQAVATALCPLASIYGYPVLLGYVVAFGLCDGCWSVMVGMGTELIVGKVMMPRAFGNLYGVIAIPLILGPPVSGFIFDRLGRYDVAFYLSSAAVVIGICLMFVVQNLIPVENHKAEEVYLDSDEESVHPGKLIVDLSEMSLAGSRAASQLLIHRRGIHGNDIPSRPCSLVISRLLEREVVEEQMGSRLTLSQEWYPNNVRESLIDDSLDEIVELGGGHRARVDSSIPSVVWSHVMVTEKENSTNNKTQWGMKSSGWDLEKNVSGKATAIPIIVKEQTLSASCDLINNYELGSRKTVVISDLRLDCDSEKRISTSSRAGSEDSGRSTDNELSHASGYSGKLSTGADSAYGELEQKSGRLQKTDYKSSSSSTINGSVKSLVQDLPSSSIPNTCPEIANQKKENEEDTPQTWFVSLANQKEEIPHTCSSLANHEDNNPITWSTLANQDKEEDMFSKLMEKALEITESLERKGDTILESKINNCRETTL
ncbi:monocarboxylate transporter 10 isoform X2 [Nematostella vectensis]|uniref:monocarboxylate transporter 10 isoform X2 n=1 Tax=Nematostella vectensis TaxID=45351 RepID=UPI00138FF27B|nr:monocarboxylate transporter 10 isoform X2 [Nematostella vectensis]